MMDSNRPRLILDVILSLVPLSSLIGSILPQIAWAEIRPETVHVANTQKTQSYVHDGLITGGDGKVNQVLIQDIRRSVNAGYERIVIDLKGNQNNEPSNLQRPPFFQVAITPDERRLVLVLAGHPRLNFDPRKAMATFKKSAVIQNYTTFLPRLEDDSWTQALELKTASSVEVFELANPARIIIDIKIKKG